MGAECLIAEGGWPEWVGVGGCSTGGLQLFHAPFDKTLYGLLDAKPYPDTHLVYQDADKEEAGDDGQYQSKVGRTPTRVELAAQRNEVRFGHVGV